jgi:hypothetical protein
MVRSLHCPFVVLNSQSNTPFPTLLSALNRKKMGFTGDGGGETTSSSDSLFIGTVLIQVFAGNIGLYGLIIALILSQLEYDCEEK